MTARVDGEALEPGRPMLEPGLRSVEAWPSTAAIGGHPIHPAVVPLPIGMLAAATMGDVAHRVTGDRFFARASRWLLGGGILTGAMAAGIGLVDFATIRAARSPLGFAHAGGNALILALSGLSLALRTRSGSTPTTAAVLSLVAALLLAVTGWLGGELTFRKRIGVVPSPASDGPD